MDDPTRTAALSADHMHFPMVMALLSGSAQAARIPPFGGLRVVVEPDRKLDGKMMHSVLHTNLIDVDMSASLRLLIDPDTKLVKQIQEFLRFTSDQLAWIDKEEPAGAGTLRDRGPPQASRHETLRRNSSLTSLLRTSLRSGTSSM